MDWYNYLFAALAVLGLVGSLFIGLPQSARQRNTAGVLAGAIIIAMWAFVFYWNVYGF